MSPSPLLLACALIGCAHYAPAEEPAPSTLAPEPRDPLSPAALMETVGHLASPELAGRQAGSPEYEQAAGWAAARFAAWGLQAAGDEGDYLQRFELDSNRIRTCQLGLPGWSGEPLRLGQDYACRGFSGSGQLEAPVSFVGYGLSLPERGYDDYAGLDMTGRVALAFKEAPAWQLKDGGWGEAHMPRPKAQAAADHGALGLLLVSRPDLDWNRKPIGSVMHGPGAHLPGLPALQLDPPLAEHLLAGGDQDLAALQARIDQARAPASQPLQAPVRVQVEATYQESAQASNVLALLPGTDLASELVIVGAHLDHVGQQADVVYPGANDNASGSAVVLALAEALAAQEQRQRRSVLFALFAAEENGLLGSQHLASHLPVASDQVVAMVNLDCVGHGSGKLKRGGGKASPLLWNLARGLDAAELSVEQTWYGGGADAQAFFDAGIPTLYFATEDSYTHLHKPGDLPDTLDSELLAGVARLAYATVAKLAAGGYEREERKSREK